MSTAAQYISKIESFTAGKDPLVMQQETLEILAKLIAGVPDEKLRRKPAPNKWSVIEILAHLAEDEIATSWRLRQMLENSGCELAAFEQDIWARLGDYASWNAAETLELFRILRQNNLRMLRRLTPEEWERFGVHSERGKTSVRLLTKHMAGHDMNHVEQIRKILGIAG
jgi:hypothetical protein